MRTGATLLLALMSCALVASARADFRIAYSCDGNQHDADDWHASAMVLAMLAETGMTNRLVHFDYNNHLGDNAPWRADAHRQVIADAIRRYGYDTARFHDDQLDLKASIASLARAVNASNADDRLCLLCAGPMELCWRGIDAAFDHKERFVTVISHGRWNESHADTPELRHTWADIQQDFDVTARHIRTQNASAFRSAPSAWDWLREVRHGEWLHPAVATGRKAGDASDAGLVYYVIDGRGTHSDRATMDDIRGLFSVP
jgi:hypothetical protein